MKRLLKRLLLFFGLFKYVKRVQKFLFPNDFDKKYGRIRRYVLKRNNINVAYNTTDKHSKRWFYPRYDNGNIHEPVATDLFIQHLCKEDCVFDLGAHLGYFTCLASKLTPNGEVHSFEVDGKCVPLIKRNLKINKLKNVFVNNYAVSDHNDFEKIPLMKNPNPCLKINRGAIDFKEVKAITIDDYVRSNNLSPNFIKIDVEGAEWKVLNGMQEVLNKNNVKLLIEVHVETLAVDFNTDYKQILSLLENKGYHMEEIESHRMANSNFRRIDRNSELNGNTMIFCFKTPLPLKQATLSM